MLSAGYFSVKEELYIPQYRYKKITGDTTGVEDVVWQPSSGKKVRVSAMVVSVTTAGQVEIKDGTTGATIVILEFGERKAVPFSFDFMFELDTNHALSAKFTTDTGTGDCHITAFGEER